MSDSQAERADAPEWAITRNGSVREAADATKMALRDYGLNGNDSAAFDFGAGFMRGVEYGKLLATPSAIAQPPVTKERIQKVAETLGEAIAGESDFKSWGHGYRQDENGKYTIPNVPEIAFEFARALLQANGAKS